MDGGCLWLMSLNGIYGFLEDEVDDSGSDDDEMIGLIRRKGSIFGCRKILLVIGLYGIDMVVFFEFGWFVCCYSIIGDDFGENLMMYFFGFFFFGIMFKKCIISFYV